MAACGVTVDLDLTWWVLVGVVVDATLYVGFYWLGKRRGYARAVREAGGA